VSFAKGAVTLEQFGQVELKDGVRDGEIVDVARVAAAIEQLWKSAKFSSKKVIVGVANQKVIVRQVDLPLLPEKELKSSLAYQVQDFVPMPVDQALLDFHPLEEMITPAGARIVRGLLVAASRAMVASVVEAVQLAGLTPTSVDLTPFAVLRALGQDEVSPDRVPPVEALVDIGARVTNIIVHEGGAPRFVRILLMGGQHVTESLADRLGIPFEQAEALKQQLSEPGESSAEVETARRVVEFAIASFVDEIRGSLDYYMASSGSAQLTRLSLSGGGSRLAGLAERLAAATRLPVDLASPLTGMVLGATGLSPEQLELVSPVAAVPVGLALGAA
jgi:type IV pilus assembly protein PilM